MRLKHASALQVLTSSWADNQIDIGLHSCTRPYIKFRVYMKNRLLKRNGTRLWQNIGPLITHNDKWGGNVTNLGGYYPLNSANDIIILFFCLPSTIHITRKLRQSLELTKLLNGRRLIFHGRDQKAANSRISWTPYIGRAMAWHRAT